MSDNEVNKTSDEILKELFHSLNVPLSPSFDTSLTNEDSISAVDSSPKKAPKKKRKGHSKSGSENSSPKLKSGTSKLNKQSRSRSRSNSHSKSQSSKHRPHSNSKTKQRSRSRSKSKGPHSKSRSKRSNSNSTTEKRSKSKRKSRSNSRSRRSHSRERGSHIKSHSKSKRRKSRSRSRSRHSYSRSYSRDKNSRSRSYSRHRHKSRSHSKNRHSHSRSKSKYRSHSRSRSKDTSKNQRSFKRGNNVKSRSRYSSCSSSDGIARRRHPTSKSPSRKSKSPPKSKDPLDIWKQTKLAELTSAKLEKPNLSETANQTNEGNNLSSSTNEVSTSVASQPSLDVKIGAVHFQQDTLMSYGTNADETSKIIEGASQSSEGENKTNGDCDVKFVPLPSTEPSATKTPAVTCKMEENLVMSSNEKCKEQEKPKGIVIKSLKDSQVFQQAVEEANKKPKEEVKSISSNKVFEEGEIISDNEATDEKPKSRKKHHSKIKDDAKSSRESKSRSRRHRRSRSRSPNRRRSRSRSRDRKAHRKEKRRRRSHSRGKKQPASPDCVDSLRDKATRKRLLEIARRNAMYLMRNNCLPPSIEKESMKVTGKSVEELTNFCKQLVTKGDYSDPDLSPSLSEEEGDETTPFSGTRHPFAIKDSKPILMNIRNAPMLPTKTNAERLADNSKLREQFPVSSGSQHRNKESEWVPVEKDEKEKKEAPPVFELPKMVSCLDISQVVSSRVSAIRKLQDNPNDKDARDALTSAQSDMENWVLSKQVPGQFTGHTGARVLSQEELSSGYQAWARKEKTPHTPAMEFIYKRAMGY